MICLPPSPAAKIRGIVPFHHRRILHHRFLPGMGNVDDGAGTAKLISSKLITALQLAWIKWTDVTDYHYTVLRPRSTRTSCLIILLVMVMPLFNLWAYPEEVCGQGRKGIGLVLSIQGGCLPCSKCSQNHSRSNFTKDAYSKILKLKRDNFKDFRKTTTGLVSKFFHGDPRGLLCPKSLAIFTAAFWNCGLLHRKVPG